MFKLSLVAVLAVMMLPLPTTNQFALAGVIGDAVPYNGHVYYLLEQSSWSDAEVEAVSLGGHLVTINEQAENDFVFDTFTAILGDDAGLWIGLNDIAQEGTWVWLSGEPVTFTNWAAREPNDWSTGEDVVHMLWKSDPRVDGSWNDSPNVTNSPGVTIHGVVEVVPEPSTIILWSLALGVAGFGWWRKRKV